MTRTASRWLILLALVVAAALAACEGCEDRQDVPEPEVPTHRSNGGAS